MLADPRDRGVLVPGVANRDARAVAQARLERLRRALQAGEPIGEMLYEAVQLGVWRGHAVTSFDVYVDALVGIDAARAHALVDEETARRGVPPGPLRDYDVAIWYRIESAMLAAGVEGTVRHDGTRLWIGLEAGAMPVLARQLPLALRQMWTDRLVQQRRERAARRRRVSDQSG